MRRRLIPVVALAVALGVAVVWLLLARPSWKEVSADASTPPRTARAGTLDRARPEIQVGREFRLEEFMGFDPEFAPWLSLSQERYGSAGVRAGGGVRTPEQVASIPAEQRRSEVR